MSDTDGADPDIADRVTAAAARATTDTPGVARLAPYALSAARTAVTSTAKRVTARLTGRDDDAPNGSAVTSDDTNAVDVERHADGTMTVTVRIVAATTPPIRDVARDVALRVAEQVHSAAGMAADVTVHVVDVEV